MEQVYRARILYRVCTIQYVGTYYVLVLHSRESWGCSADMSQKETNEWCSSRTCVVAASLLFLRTLLESPQFSLVKVEKILKGSLDLIPSPSPSVKIQIWAGKLLEV